MIRHRGPTRRKGASRTSPLLLTLMLGFAPISPAHAAPTTPTITVNTAVLTPYHSGGCWNPRYPCYRVIGKADPGIEITVTVTDDPPAAHSVVVTTRAAKVTDPGSGVQAGDWAVAPNVTDLGTHGTEESALVFTATARDQFGAVSSPAVARAKKTAATLGDTQGPLIKLTKRPPDVWCHTGVLCFATTNFQYTGFAEVAGSVEDDVPGAYGLASEIADVVISVIDAQEGSLIHEFHSFTRRGTQAFYGRTLAVTDYEPLKTYTITVDAIDALGQSGNTVSASFLLLP